MKKKTTILLSGILLCLMSCTPKATNKDVTLAQLRDGFNNPPKEAQVCTWWHWLDGNVTREGITADLEAMHRVGIHEATLFNGGMGFPQGPIEYMSDEWLTLFQHAASEAKRLDMELSFHNGPGWSSSGGPWIKPEDAMQTVTWSERQVEGGRTVCLVIPKPTIRHEYYQDIAVLAFPTPASAQRIDDLNNKTLANNAFSRHLMPSLNEIPDSAVVRLADIVDLTSQMQPGGTLQWDAPTGQWTILRIGFTPTGMTNHPALAGGNGLECDKMSRKALDAFWASGIQPIIDKLGPLVGSGLTGSLIDSYEVGCGNWTLGFEKEFKARRHYDILPYLPAMAGYYIESGPVAERFLWDLRLTVGELMAENYYDYFAELCHKHGMRFLTEPYEGPFNALEIGRKADVPMSEFWVGSNWFAGMANMAASIAHANGSQIVGAESFTATGSESRHRNYPGMLKAQGDYNWSNGVNRFILHTNAHQPWEVGPGFSLGEFGTNFNRHNTWWEQSRAWMDYCARSQYLLQQGEGVQDILVFIGESSPNMGIERPEVREIGLDYDQISATQLKQLSVQDGMLCSSVGHKYRVMVLSGEEQPTLALLRQLKSFTESGACIIGPRPKGQPTLEGYPESDVEYQELVDELWGSEEATDGMIQDITISEAMEKTGLKPDFTGADGDTRLRWLHRSTKEAEIYFISNQQKEYRTERCTFRISGHVPELWHAQKGTMERVPAWTENNVATEIELAFAPEEAYFIVFREPSKDDVQFTSIAQEINVQDEPLPGLEILRAEYGQFMLPGIADITEIISSHIHDGHINVQTGNGLAGGDPCFGIPKTTRVAYTINGKEQTATVQENTPLILPRPGENGELQIITAFYGNIPTSFCGRRAQKPADVTNQIRARIDAGVYIFNAGEISSNDFTKVEGLGNPKLHLVYKVGGEVHEQLYTAESIVDLRRHKDEPRVVIENGEPYWLTPAPGQVKLTDAKGQPRKAQIQDVPEPITLDGGWQVHFNQKWGKEWDTQLPQLIPLNESEEEDIRFFSGTAVYTSTFTLPEDYLNDNIVLEARLGQVYVIAELFVNGQDMGILWHNPYSKDITKALQPGKNTIEVRVTNQWINRLIGDERLPVDYKQNGILYAEWPEWMQHPEQRTTGRTTFVAWKHWGADDALQPSGLVGPVVIKPYAKVKIK
jgi:hypothetical protein